MFLFMLVVAESSLLFSMLIVRLVSRWERKTFAHLRAELPPGSLALKLDEDGRLCYSPAVGVLVAGSRRTLAQWQKATALHEVDPDLLELAQALREVDAEAHALVEREVGAQPLANKEAFPHVDHELETPKPGGEPGSDVVSELLAPDPSVTSSVEK